LDDWAVYPGNGTGALLFADVICAPFGGATNRTMQQEMSERISFKWASSKVAVVPDDCSNHRFLHVPFCELEL
jgi:hypothetical protein